MDFIFLVHTLMGDMYTKPVTDKLEEFTTSCVIYAVMPLENNAFQVAAPSEVDDEWIVRLNCWNSFLIK